MQAVLEAIDSWLSELAEIALVGKDYGQVGIAEERLKRWVRRTKSAIAKALNEQEAKTFDPVRHVLVSTGDRQRDFFHDVAEYSDKIIALRI